MNGNRGPSLHATQVNLNLPLAAVATYTAAAGQDLRISSHLPMLSSAASTSAWLPPVRAFFKAS